MLIFFDRKILFRNVWDGYQTLWLKTNFAVVMSDLQQHVVPATNCLWDCDIC